MRFLGIDLGRKRVGLAISDASGLLARPLVTLTVTGAGDAADRVMTKIEELAAQEDGLAAVVVGVPRRLDGSDNSETAAALKFINTLKRRLPLRVVGAEERLTSQEAESRLAVGERDWRERKKKLDAAAAAIILQDFLDQERAGRA